MNALGFAGSALKILLFAAIFALALGLAPANASVNLQYYTSPSIAVSPSTAAWGQYTTLSFSVINTGSTASGQFLVEFYLSSTPTINTSTSFLWYTQPAPSLSTGQSYGGPLSINLPGTIPSGLANGTVYIGMVIVLNGTVVESNVGLGKDLTTITTTAPATLPDLIGYNGTPFGNSYCFAVQQSAVTWGQTLGVQFAVFNQTVINAGAFTGNIYISETNHFVANSSTCYQIGSFSASSLYGGGLAVSNGYINYALPNTNPFGDSSTTFYVGMVINPNQAVTESNYANDSNQGPGIDEGATPVTITAAVPEISAVSSTPPGNNLNFGSLAVDGPGGALATQTITITNNGAAPLNITGISLTGSSVFSITSVGSTITVLSNPNTYPASIAPDGLESWVVTVTYDPTIVGNQTATLVINSNDPTTPSLSFSLAGTGIAVPNLVLSNPIPSNNNLVANYGNVVNDGAGGASLSETFTLTNTGSAQAMINTNGVTLTNTEGGVWSITSITSNTQGTINLSSEKPIAPGGVETWSIVVKFDPTANTNYLTGLQIAPAPTDGEDLINCTLQGTGIIPMTISVASAVNSANDTNPLVMNFGSVHATGQQSVTGTVTLTNTGQMPLIIAQNGISLGSSTNFQITGITSSTQGTINLSSGTATIAANGAETWTINVVFTPTAIVSDNTTLTILSNDPAHGTESIALEGTGLNQPGILVTTPKGGTNLPFGPVLNDGAGNHVGKQTFTIQNIGLQSLIISQNGITLVNATGFSIQSIVSSTQGTINLSSGSATIAAREAETWTVTVGLDPTSNTAYTGTLNIASNDPVSPTVSLALTGSGTTPTLTLNPTTSSTPTLYIEAGQVYNITWTAADISDTASSATLTLSTTASNSSPASGLTSVATLPYSSTMTSYTWRPSASMVGQAVYIYGNLQDQGVSTGSFSAQKVYVEAAGSFNLLTAVETTSSNYTYQYIYNGTVYSGTATLQPGQNVVTITTPLSGGGNATHQITVTMVSSLLSVQGYTYDELGRIKTATNGNGITTSYQYDLAGDLVQTSATNGDVISYTYDNAKNKLSMTDSTGTTFYDYDDLNRMIDVIYSASGNKTDPNNLAIDYQYDNANRLTNMTYPGGEQIQYVWDNAGRLTHANDLTTNQNTTYTYNYTTGLLTSVSRANGVVTTYAYNGSGFLDDIQHKLGSQLLAEYNYTLNSSGMATALLTTFQNGSQKQELFTYDGLNRLVQAVYGSSATASPNDKTIIYAYDGVGNRLTQTTKVNGSTTQVLTYTYGVENRLASVTDQNNNLIANYFYDAAGNRIQKVTPTGNTYYSYDERNLLTAVLTPTDYVTYTYNGAGQRVRMVLDGTLTQYIIDPHQTPYQTVQERSSSGITKSYIYGSDRLTGNPTSGTAEFYLPDRIESVRLITDPNGNVTSSYSYDAFGAVSSP